ncbi:MAG: glycosyltransferase family 39 protein [Actinobacteria bacterium]|nr:glycosyltransferase family 39 protein [Actinomycetota bacterium]
MKKIVVLALIVIILIVRFWGLDKIPPHLRNDEAALGYNAYSILQTAKDEHGQFLPILFQSFGDWKPGLYIYLTVPLVAILGLNEWAVRLPAAISGILGIYLLYILVINLFQNKKIAFFAAFSLALAPWHIAFSRSAWEAQVTVTLLLAGLIFLLKSVNNSYKYLPVSAAFFGISLLTSHSAKPAVPLLLLSFSLAYWRKLSKVSQKTIILSSLIFIILSLPIILSFFNNKDSRISSLLFTNKYPNTKFVVVAKDLLIDWSNHYSLPALFIKGDNNPQHTAVNFGAFLTLDIIFLFLGIRTLAKVKTIKKEVRVFLLISLILTPLSSVLTSEGVNFVRFLWFFILVNILIGLGLSNFKKNILWGILPIAYIFSFLLFLDAYFIHTPSKNGAWQYGYKEIVNFISPRQKNYQKIYIPQGNDQPYIFFLFYQKYPPEKFQKIPSSVTIRNGSNIGMDYIANLDNIEFVDFKQFIPPIDKSYLIVLPANNNYTFSSSLKIIYEVKDLLGFPIYKIGEK